MGHREGALVHVSRFDRYIYGQLLAVFGFFALVLVGVYWINRAVGLFDQLIGDGQSALVFLEFSALTLPNVIKLVLPVAAFAATVYVTNRLMADSELVVMQATGFSAARMARPILGFGLSVTLMMLILTNILVPRSRVIISERRAEMSESVTSRFLKPGQFLHPSSGITLYIGRIADNGALEDLMLTDTRQPQVMTTYTAGTALFIRGDLGPKLIMINGMIQHLDRSSTRLSITRFDDFTYDLGSLLAGQQRLGRTADQVSTLDLFAPTPELEAETRSPRAALIFDAHARLADPLLAIGAALIGFGALLQGSFSRFGLIRQISLAVALMVGVQAVATAAVKAGNDGPLGWALAYLAPVLAMACGAVLLWWAGRPRRVAPPAQGVQA